MNVFLVGEKVRFFPRKGRWTAPPGSLAVVTGFSRSVYNNTPYLYVEWVRETPHNQMDGGYLFEDFVKVDTPFDEGEFL